VCLVQGTNELSIKVTIDQLNRIRRHAEETYPHECCGFLLGTNEDGINLLGDLYRAENEWRNLPGALTADGRVESQENRYLITPEQWMQADTHARQRGLGIIGYYHSHPDHPARPSAFDLDHSCWPGESYIIVAVEKGRAAALNSFTKPDYSKFEPEEIIIRE
jgi:proteasome lid subunit RPN8/RPN11